MAQKWLKIAKMAQQWPKMARKLAPAKKNSRDISPVSLTFCISADSFTLQLSASTRSSSKSSARRTGEPDHNLHPWQLCRSGSWGDAPPRERPQTLSPHSLSPRQPVLSRKTPSDKILTCFSCEKILVLKETRLTWIRMIKLCPMLNEKWETCQS